MALTPVAAQARPADPLDAVNTFIGTQDEGNTFPGASAPFGMVQSSPITTHYAGYLYTDTEGAVSPLTGIASSMRFRPFPASWAR